MIWIRHRGYAESEASEWHDNNFCHVNTTCVVIQHPIPNSCIPKKPTNWKNPGKIKKIGAFGPITNTQHKRTTKKPLKESAIRLKTRREESLWLYEFDGWKYRCINKWCAIAMCCFQRTKYKVLAFGTGSPSTFAVSNQKKNHVKKFNLDFQSDTTSELSPKHPTIFVYDDWFSKKTCVGYMSSLESNQVTLC